VINAGELRIPKDEDAPLLLPRPSQLAFANCILPGTLPSGPSTDGKTLGCPIDPGSSELAEESTVSHNVTWQFPPVLGYVTNATVSLFIPGIGFVITHNAGTTKSGVADKIPTLFK
jgi:hypothetical protein